MRYRKNIIRRTRYAVGVRETPILDLEKAPPKQGSRWRLWLIGLAVGGPLGLALAMFTQAPLSWHELLIIPALYVAITVHELGHLLAGRMVGMKAGGMAVGGFGVMKSGAHYSFRFDYRRLMCGGMALLLTTKNQSTPGQFAWMVAGGPIASLLLTALCGCLSLVRSSSNGGWTAAWIIALFWVSLLLTVGSLIPGWAGINRTDGAMLWLLLRHPERLRSWMALLALQSEDREGVRPRDWDPELVEGALRNEPAAKEYPYSEMLMFYRQVDLENEAAAVVHLESALAASGRLGSPFRRWCFLEAASASTIIRKSPDQARIWLHRSNEVRRTATTAGVDGAIAMCEGRFEDALRHLAAERALFQRLKLDSRIARFAVAKLEEAEKRCRESLAARTKPEIANRAANI